MTEKNAMNDLSYQLVVDDHLGDFNLKCSKLVKGGFVPISDPDCLIREYLCSDVYMQAWWMAPAGLVPTRVGITEFGPADPMMMINRKAMNIPEASDEAASKEDDQ